MVDRVAWIVLLAGCLAARVAADEPAATFEARDSLALELRSPEHREVLRPMGWEPGPFTVERRRPEPGESDADWLLSFPSPLPRGVDAVSDVVWVEWYVAADVHAGADAPPAAVLIIPETDRRRHASKAIARVLRNSGVHGLVLQPPGYGRRRIPGADRDAAQLVPTVRQTAADARRTRDALAALDELRGGSIHLAGLSLGGFIASLSAALDGGFDGTFILLAGGDLNLVLSRGQRDAAKVRERLVGAGFDGERLRELLWQVEPLRVADRLVPERTWLYSGRFDTVIPLESATRLAEAVPLPAGHHVVYAIDHYSGVLILPVIVGHMAEQVRGVARDEAAATP